MSMCVCGQVSDDDARFCRDCGRSLDTTDQHEVLLLDHEAVPSAPSTTVVRRGGWNGSGGNWPIALVALGAVVALAAWAIGRGSDAGSVADPIAEASTSTTTPVSGRESTLPSSQDLSAGSDGSAELVGLEGTQLIISTTGRPALLDLASRQVTYHEGERLSPVAVYDRWLIVVNYDGGTAKILLDDLGGVPELLIEVDDAVYTGVVSAPGQVERGQIWVSADRPTSANELETTFYLIDLDTGAVIDERAGDAWDPFAFLDGGSGLARGLNGGLTGGLVTGPAGGVYEETDDGYRLVTEGRLLAADDRRALVQTCDPKLVCSVAWLDRGSWEPLDLVPPDPPDATITFISGTDWVVATAYGYVDGGDSSVMTNIVTGQMVELYHANRARNGSVFPPAISPDGQWLAQIADDPRTLELRNLVSGERQVIELDRAADGHLFFVEV